jgi:hypothetical protein
MNGSRCLVNTAAHVIVDPRVRVFHAWVREPSLKQLYLCQSLDPCEIYLCQSLDHCEISQQQSRGTAVG